MSHQGDGKTQPRVVVTTSWDDGHVLDLKVADLLDDYDLAGTFYVATQNVEFRSRDRLGPHGTQAIGQRFEIGAHTRLHMRLTTLSLAAANKEIVGGKTDLEDVIGREVQSFCYPGGLYRAEHVTLVRDAGFCVARTVRRYSTVPFPRSERCQRLLMHTGTLQTRPHY